MAGNAADIDNIDQSIINWVVEKHPLPVLVTAGEGHSEHERNDILYANDAFVEMTGYTKEEILGEKPKILQGRRPMNSWRTT